MASFMKPTVFTDVARVFAGHNGTVKIGPDPAIKDLWRKLMTDNGRIEGQVGFRTFGICHNFNGSMMEYLAAVEVTKVEQVPGNLHTLFIPKRRVAVFRHEGRVETLSETWAWALDAWLPQASLLATNGPQYEVYSADFDDVAGTGSIEIHIPVR